MANDDVRTPPDEAPLAIGQSTISQSAVSWIGAGGSILLARGSDALLRFLLFLATARILTPDDFSIYALLTAALATCQWSLSLGAPRLALFFAARGRRGPLEAWLSVLAIGAALFVSLLLFGAPPLRRALFPALSFSWIVLGLAPLPFSLLADSFASLLIAGGRTRAYGATLWMRNGGMAIVLASSLAVDERLGWILAGRLIVQAGVAAVSALAARVRLRTSGLAEFAPEALRFGIPTALSDAVVALHRRADVILLSALGRESEIGAYALAYALAEALWLVTDSLETALFVDITRRDEMDARGTARRALRISILASAAQFAVGLAAGQAVLRLFFASRYPAAVALLPWTVGAAVAWGISRPLSSFLASRARVKVLLACRTVGLLVNLAANLLLIPRLGARGAAIASLASYAFDSVVLWAVFAEGSSRTEVPGLN